MIKYVALFLALSVAAVAQTVPTIPRSGISSTGAPVSTAADVAGTFGTKADATIAVNAKNQGAVGDGSTIDYAAIQAAISLAPNGAPAYLPPGTYPTGLPPTADSVTTFGPGRLKDSSGNLRAPHHTTIQAAPTSTNGTGYNYSAFYNTDWSHTIFAAESAIKGTCTLGCPATGYMWTPETSVINLSVLNNSGWNQDTVDNGGRTGYSAIREYLTSGGGGGDTMGIDEEIQVGGAKAGATSFLANPAGSFMSGDIGALNAGVFLQGIGDLNFSDNGFDVAAVPIVLNLLRTNNTGALGATWTGIRLQSGGTKAIDAFFSGVGLATIGIDFAGITTTPFAAMTLAANQKIYFNATNTDAAHFSQNTAFGTTFLDFDGTQLLAQVGGNATLQVKTNQINVNGAVNLNGLSGMGMIYDTGSALVALQYAGTPVFEIGANSVNIVGNLLIATGKSVTIGTSPGLSCSGTPTSSFASINGIVTHC